MKTNTFSLFLFLLLFLFSFQINAQISRSITKYDEFVFCVITEETSKEKLNLIQGELETWGYRISYSDLAFNMHDKVKSIQLHVETKEGYSGKASMNDENPMVYFYQLFNNAKVPFKVGSGKPDAKFPGQIKDELLERGGGYEFAFNPEKDQDFSPSRIMGADTDYQKYPAGMMNPLIIFDDTITTEAIYLKMIREDYPMDEYFMGKEEAIIKYGAEAGGGAIVLTTIE